MEQPHKPDVKISLGSYFLRIVGVAGLAALAGIGLNMYSNSGYEAAYEVEFTDEDGCLRGSPYDPAEGATLSRHNIKGSNILRVKPQHMRPNLPDELLLSIDRDQYGLIIFTPSDYQSGAYLHESNCAGYSDGY